MNISSTIRLLVVVATLFGAALSDNALAATHSENFENATGNANSFTSASGMYFSTSGSSFLFSTQFNSYFSPYIAGKFPTTGCNGCTAPTMNVAWPSGQRSLVFGWGTQGYSAVRVTAYRNGLQVWQQNQSGTASSGLYKQQFSRVAANASEYFDKVAITWPGGGQAGVGYGVLLDNFVSIDAYATPSLAGNNQETPVGKLYVAPVSVVVLDYQNHPVANLGVVFSAPSSEDGVATVIFAATGATFDTDVTDANGIAMSSLMTANAIEGPLLINVSTSPSVGLAEFHLRNLSADTIFANNFE